MSNMAPYVRSPGGGQLSRQTARDLATIDQATEIATARAAAAGDVQQARIDAVARAGAYAMQQVALVSQMQQQLALAAPAASGDLDFIKTMTVLGIGQVVADTSRTVNR
jgi:hypothetical protein